MVLLKCRAFSFILPVQTASPVPVWRWLDSVFLAYCKRRDFLVKLFYFPFLAAAHRWDDSQALSCEDR